MGSEMDVYTLCEVSNLSNPSTTRLVIFKAVRPHFSNVNQQSEEDAYTVLEQRQKSLIDGFCKSHNFTSHKLIADFYGYPEGDIFYERSDTFEVDVWIAMYKDDKPYFCFGIAETEDAFWTAMKDSYEDDDSSNYYPDLIRPAIKESIVFIQ